MRSASMGRLDYGEPIALAKEVFHKATRILSAPSAARFTPPSFPSAAKDVRRSKLTPDQAWTPNRAAISGA